MNNLTVWLEQAGEPKVVGYIETVGPASGEFRYGEEYLADPLAKGLSLSLPLQAEAFLKRMDLMADGLEKYLRESAAELKQAGFREAEQMAEAILRVGGMAYWK